METINIYLTFISFKTRRVGNLKLEYYWTVMTIFSVTEMKIDP